MGTMRRTGRRAAALALSAGLAAAGAGLVRRAAPFRVAVAGRSMEPALWDGDYLLAVRLRRPPRRGDIVVLGDPRTEGFELVKRIAAAPGEVAPDGRRLGPEETWVVGDRAERSTDSRTLGPVGVERVGGLVVLRYWPPSRFGRVR